MLPCDLFFVSLSYWSVMTYEHCFRCTRFFSCEDRGNRCPILWTDNAFGKVAVLVVLKFEKKLNDIIHNAVSEEEGSGLCFL